ncbi:hypothetical protein HanHA300_Chr11g0384431 [Helianthus annuus]|nr:hypothetical protein HanHA300_Chr11g0384431 [Helianthus annuus]KAJ0683808.1 hypothetical protein HanLR1_Chr11g0384361 [Helianthus annuus]KAJ0687773.1 hypothetical protein HanOQP8_Chr11g0387111 [Helianthus annuus]
MVTALSFLVDEIWPPYIAKSSGVVERSLAVQRISEENVVSGGSINQSGIESKNSSF